MSKSNRFLVALIAILLIVVIALFAFLKLHGPSFDEIHAIYEKGETAPTAEERREYFNRALRDYLQLEEDYRPKMGNGILYYNIGNTFFQLGEYPMATYYYLNALQLRPRDKRLLDNMAVTAKRLHLEHKEEPSAFRPLVLFHKLLSVPERLQLFCLLAVALFIVLSLHLWRGIKRIKTLGFLLGLALILLGGSLFYSYYIAPIEAVVIKSSDLFLGAGKHYAHVSEKAIPSGNIVHVYESLEEGKWLRVESPTGEMGYLPSEILKIVYTGY